MTLQARAQSTPAILTFFALTFAWSWGIGIAANDFRESAPALNAALMMLSGYGPTLAAILVVLAFSPRTGEGTGLCTWLARCLNWRVGWKYYAFSFCLPPTLMVISLVLHSLLGGPMPRLVSVDHIPLAILNFGLVLLVGGPLGEEFGWRGYALPTLAAKLNWRLASLIIGVVWGLWHAPLFFMAATLQSQMHMAVFMLNILAGSVVFAWLSERTGQSVIPALVLHTSLNGWTGILGIVPTAETGRPYLLLTGLLVLVAVVMLMKPQNSKIQHDRVRKSHDISR